MFSAQSNPLIPSLAKWLLAAKEITLGKTNRIFITETLAIDPECILWHCLGFALYIFILVLMCCSMFLKSCSLSPALQDLSLRHWAAGSCPSAPIILWGRAHLDRAGHMRQFWFIQLECKTSNWCHFCYATGRTKAIPDLVWSSLFHINKFQLKELFSTKSILCVVWLRWFRSEVSCPKPEFAESLKQGFNLMWELSSVYFVQLPW